MRETEEGAREQLRALRRENTRLVSENVRLLSETREALERQTATAEILRVISSSPTDLKPVLDVILTSAERYCGAEDVLIHLREGDTLVASAHAGPIKSTVPLGRGPVPISRDAPPGLAVLERRTVHVADLQASDEFPVGQEIARRIGFRTALATPLLRGGDGIGAITLRRTVVRPFSDREIELLETFASQAAIAIENVRLFNETREALERQTATGEILRVISTSPTDLQPVLDAIAENARRFCAAEDVLVQFREGDGLITRAHAGTITAGIDLGTPVVLALDRASVAGAAVIDGLVVQVDDPLTDLTYPRTTELGREFGFRTTMAVPLLRQGDASGAIVMRRAEARAFNEREIALARTFADQAVIAIENVRLFNETKEALEQQTAIADVLAATASATADARPVFEAILRHAVELCGAEDAILRRRDGGDGVVVARIAAHPAVLVEAIGHRAPISTLIPGARLFASGADVVHVPDMDSDPEYGSASRSRPDPWFKTVLGVAVHIEGQVYGWMTLARHEARPFTDRQIDLVRTLASQAAIAIENVRLFNETKESLERQTAIGEILRVISRSTTDIQPVLDAIAENAARYCQAEDAVVMLPDGDLLRAVAHYGPVPIVPEGQPVSSFTYPIDRGSLNGRSFLEGRVLHTADIWEEADEYPHGAAAMRRLGAHAGAVVPLLRDGAPVGTLSLRRTEARAFTDKQLDLLQTFADQAVIAIENVRLFNETKESLERQMALGEILQVIASSPTAQQPVLDAIVRNAVRFCGGEDAILALLVNGQFSTRAHYGPIALRTPDELWLADRKTVIGRAVVDGQTVQSADTLSDPEFTGSHATSKRFGFRAVLATPLLREGTAIGGIALRRSTPGPFSVRDEELLRAFAAQAVIALENVRQFNEIQDKSRQLEIAGRHKSEFLANMSHELRTPLNAIIGFSDVLLNGMFGQLNEKQREYQEDVLSSGRHLLTLINDILDLSKIEAGRVELELGEFSLPEALENGVTMIRERAAKHGIRVQIDVAGVDRIVADERKVKQVVFNLLSNAVKFTPDGGRVDVQAARDNGEVRVAVRDNGIGIDEADRERIFEEFQQASRDSERSREGTGLGLALSKRYVELHGGRIWVESEVGRGSTFTFALPLTAGDKARR